MMRFPSGGCSQTGSRSHPTGPKEKEVSRAPVRAQRKQTALLVLLHPFPNAARTAVVNVHDLLDGHAHAVQAHRLQPLQFMYIAGLLLRLPELFNCLLVELKLSFRHAMIVT